MPQDILSSINHWLNDEKVFVCYRLPQTDIIKGITQTSTDIFYTETLTEEGFVMAPFDNSKKAILIPKNQSTFYEFDDSLIESHPIKNHEKNKLDHESCKEDYIKLIEKTIEFIKSGEAQKIVISRAVLKTIDNKEISSLFSKLHTTYTNAFVYVWHHPKIGLWIGATPERLITLKNKTFSTMALAGTQKYSNAIQWQPKEIEEQDIVKQFIISNINDYCNSIEVSKTFTKKAGPLAHLCTDISGTIKDDTTFKQLLNKLHPTPAVGGVPKAVSKDFILNNENYDREFYTGYLGYIDTAKPTEIFVNLRCMQVFNNKVKIYIGGGITADSVPEKEWQETIDKSKVLLKIL